MLINLIKEQAFLIMWVQNEGEHVSIYKCMIFAKLLQDMCWIVYQYIKYNIRLYWNFSNIVFFNRIKIKCKFIDKLQIYYM